ncbi:MAG TPA: DUF4129 domain-containing protein, partial [Chitinophagaceae bacterium]|nr:DUF4129 domain-containing protein [Chitinophagaceae bacterium]
IVDEEVRKSPRIADTPVFRQVPDSAIRRLQRQKEFEYANDPEYWVKADEDDASSDGTTYRRSWEDRISESWLRYVIFALLVGILLYAIVKIAISNKLILFKGTGPSMTDEEQELLQQQNIRDLIAEAEQKQQFRLAVRYRYMQLLQDMDERQLIQLDAKSTNWDYVNRLGSHPLKKQFLLLTRAYEYAWYGEFEVNAEQYGFIKTEFEKLENSLR